MLDILVIHLYEHFKISKVSKVPISSPPLLGDWFHCHHFKLHSHFCISVTVNVILLKISTAIYRSVSELRSIIPSHGPNEMPPTMAWCKRETEAPSQLPDNQEDTLNPGTICSFSSPTSFHKFSSGVEKNSAGFWWSAVHFCSHSLWCWEYSKYCDWLNMYSRYSHRDI